MPPELDAEMLATLTPEERAAIEDDKPSADELAAMQRIAAGAPDDDEDDGDDDAPANAAPVEGKPATDPAPAAADTDPAPAASVNADPEPDADEPAAKAVPTYDAKLPEDFEAKVQGLVEQEQSAWAKFDEGEIDRTELQKQLRDIETSRADLNTARVKAEISQEMTAQTAQQQWANAINRSMREFAKPENGGIDYRKDEAKAADLDQFVKVLANNPANEDKPMEWFLSEAHKRVQALHGVAPAAPKQTVADATARRKPPVDAAPKTLAQVPGSDGPGDVAGEFADLDTLEGNDLEAAIAKMTPAQRERFARA